MCTPDATTSARYVYGNTVDELLIKVALPADPQYYVHDHLNSTVALTNALGSILERCDYDVYGKCYFYDPNFTLLANQQSTVGNVYLFTGRELDTLDAGSLALQYNRNRYYSSRLARWLTPDPLGITPNARMGNEEFAIITQYKDGMNYYEYVKGAPIAYFDALGLMYTGGGTSGGSSSISQGRKDSLLTKILATVTGRGLGGLVLPINIAMRIDNYYSSYEQYVFYDELNEMPGLLIRQIEEYLDSVVCFNKGKLQGESWKEVKFTPPSPKEYWAVEQAEGVSSIGYYLATSHSYGVWPTGKMLARCCGSNCEYKSVKSSWTWKDRLDANSLIELYPKKTNWAEYLAEGVVGDLIFDKALAGAFDFTILWDYNSDEKERVACR